MRHTLFAYSCLFIFSFGCSNNEQSLPYKDLFSYGLPIEIQAPDSVQVSVTDRGTHKDVTLKGENSYSIQIFSSPAYQNITNTVKEYKSDISNHPQFKEIVREEPHGFLYAFQLDSTLTNYGFRYINIKAGKEIVIQQGMLGLYSREEAETLFNYAIQSK